MTPNKPDACAVSAEPAVSASDLSADGIYPQGRKLAFAGYSGDPARDLANGFTLAGPVYGTIQRIHQPWSRMA